MKLYIVHAGYYDDEIGIYELHTNFVLVAIDVKDVKKKIKEKEIFRRKNMHIDAVQELEIVDGYKIMLTPTEEDETRLINYDYTKIKQLN